MIYFFSSRCVVLYADTSCIAWRYGQFFQDKSLCVALYFEKRVALNLKACISQRYSGIFSTFIDSLKWKKYPNYQSTIIGIPCNYLTSMEIDCTFRDS